MLVVIVITIVVGIPFCEAVRSCQSELSIGILQGRRHVLLNLLVKKTTLLNQFAW